MRAALNPTRAGYDPATAPGDESAIVLMRKDEDDVFHVIGFIRSDTSLDLITAMLRRLFGNASWGKSPCEHGQVTPCAACGFKYGIDGLEYDKVTHSSVDFAPASIPGRVVAAAGLVETLRRDLEALAAALEKRPCTRTWAAETVKIHATARMGIIGSTQHPAWADVTEDNWLQVLATVVGKKVETLVPVGIRPDAVPKDQPWPPRPFPTDLKAR